MIRNLISRNLKLYFRDFAAVFFSLLSVIVVVAMFVLFLAGIQIDSVMEATGNTIAEEKVSYLIHSWILGGLLSVTTVSSVLGGFGSMVSDREKRIIMAFRSSPIKAWIYPAVNVICSFFIGVIISTIALGIYICCIYFISGYVLPANVIISAFGMILLSALINSFIFGCICSFLKTNSSFASVSILTGTVIGFINGLYVPIGNLSETVSNVLCFFPSLHLAAIFRRIICEPAITEVFGQAPESVTESYMSDFGIKIFLNGSEISTVTSVLYSGIFGICCLIIMIMNIRKKKKEI